MVGTKKKASKKTTVRKKKTVRKKVAIKKKATTRKKATTTNRKIAATSRHALTARLKQDLIATKKALIVIRDATREELKLVRIAAKDEIAVLKDQLTAAMKREKELVKISEQKARKMFAAGERWEKKQLLKKPHPKSVKSSDTHGHTVLRMQDAGCIVVVDVYESTGPRVFTSLTKEAIAII